MGCKERNVYDKAFGIPLGERPAEPDKGKEAINQYPRVFCVSHFFLCSLVCIPTFICKVLWSHFSGH